MARIFYGHGYRPTADTPRGVRLCANGAYGERWRVSRHALTDFNRRNGAIMLSCCGVCRRLPNERWVNATRMELKI